MIRIQTVILTSQIMYKIFMTRLVNCSAIYCQFIQYFEIK